MLLSIILLAAAACFGQNQSHVVKQGETITSIARAYGVDADSLMSANKISDPQRLQVGKRLIIPNSDSIEHHVLRGETLYGIARRYEIDVRTLRSANNLPESYVLKIGDVLRIPRAAAQAPAPAAKSEPKTAVVEPKLESRLWPIAAKEVAYRNGSLGGVLLTGEEAEAVRSLTAGTVISAGPYRGFGQVVVVKTASGYSYVYGGCDRLSVKSGDMVRPGTELGRLGLDAETGKPRLSLMVFLRNNPVDPATAPRA
jgi:murein DD-endopeptidase MepM/ murein hydrolase activator NlpD